MPSILFVCTANRFRSPLATAYFIQKLVQNHINKNLPVSSAGTWTVNHQPATPEAIKIGHTVGLDLNAHRSREINQEILNASNLILVMASGHKEAISHEFPDCKDKVFLLTEAVGAAPSDIPDPYFSDDQPDKIAKEIFELIDMGYQKLIDLTGQLSTNY